MPTVLTPVDTFTTGVSVPADGDDRDAASVQTTFQGVLNRTEYLARAQHCARYTVADQSGLAADAVVALTAGFEFGGFTLVSNQIQVPAAGVYEVICQVQMTNSESGDRYFGAALMAGAAPVAQDYIWRPSATLVVLCKPAALCWQVTDPATQRLSLTVNAGGASTQGTFGVDGTVSQTGAAKVSFVDIRRIR